ncbi:hypothetical protein QBC47DRAFT_435911 [Echria macrotheca]|uniref:Signal peptide-containing protein n=1 Tax=Echria macrotheca TaxID=438768 RepID=A0AAJ0BIW9_9PEZI|nr:hypothetical protein QBC47DRAFT_435911 [Echria macrotheca]
MQFLTIPVLALLTLGATAAPSAASVEDTGAAIVARADCSRILPACFGGNVVGQTNCRCKGQKETCDLWSCPGGSPNVMVCGQAGTGCVWI